MKKFLSIFLAVAFVFSAMCMSVLAGKTHPGAEAIESGEQYWVVGEQGKDGNLNNGVEAGKFPETGVDADVSLNFTHTTKTDENGNTINSKNVIEHRYAIDITYSDLVINLGDVITKVTEGGTTESYEYFYRWNVNTYQYDLVDSQGNLIEIDPEENTELNLNQKHTFNAFTITNHSDQKIYYKAQADLEKNQTAKANMVLIADTAADAYVDKATVTSKAADGATTTAGAPGTSAMQTLSVTPAAGLDWLTVVNNLMAANITEETVVGTLTVTVSKDAFTTSNPTP